MNKRVRTGYQVMLVLLLTEWSPPSFALNVHTRNRRAIVDSDGLPCSGRFAKVPDNIEISFANTKVRRETLVLI